MIDGAMQTYALTLDKFIDHAAKWHPNVEVVTARGDGGVDRIGYAPLRARARRVSGALSDLGVRFGDRVATLAWNSQSHMEAWYAIMGMGAVCHTLNPRQTAGELAAMLKQSEARVLIVSADLLTKAKQIIESVPSVAHLLVIDGALPEDLKGANLTASMAALETMLAAAADDVVWGEFDENAASGLCFTSGTTGAPKGVTYTHRSSFLHTLRLLHADVFAITSTDVVLPVVPMFHANAWGLPFATPAAGAKLVLPGRATDGASLAELIVSENVTVAVGVPTVWLGLVEHLEANGGDVPSLKRIIVGGSALAPALMKRIERRLGVIVQTSWGMTELSPLGTSASPLDVSRDASVSGRPGIGVDLLLKDSEGEELPEQRNAEGRLHVRGAAVVSRYFGHRERATDENNWFDTGDLAKIDDDGNLIITGRAKDLIKSGGEWINPVEIETVVGALPQVSLVAVIGRSDPKWGERPILLVELRENQSISDEELLEPLHGRVASWWLPDEVVRVQTMPLAPTGKIDKMRLRSEYNSA
ncbi:long-chain-fatty-acid--CoA ligase [Hyphococcus sp.]|jgi:fatty-acyl-CoA synthase|uniref:long-chain-fatty-acid--CoA ligase n=1 Tax=Hyphococcus sp. TaxID=2038636 RepID=UPI003D0D6933